MARDGDFPFTFQIVVRTVREAGHGADQGTGSREASGWAVETVREADQGAGFGRPGGEHPSGKPEGMQKKIVRKPASGKGKGQWFSGFLNGTSPALALTSDIPASS